ncbi:MAG: right-handed parallel beta-helix repeat-containing protein [Acidobacteriota bacterium]
MKAKLLLLFISLFFIAILNPWYKPVLMAKQNEQSTGISPLVTVMVTNTADSGAGSLRTAITTTNQNPSSVIQFNIPTNDQGFDAKTGTFNIRLLSPLPAITANSTTIDGTTQPVTTAIGPRIVINGSLVTGAANGLVLNSANNTIKGLIINNFFSGAGILIAGPNSNNNTVVGCFIGTDATGKASAGNQVGVRIRSGAKSNTIGNNGLLNTNIISGNLNEGVIITDIGTDANIVAGNTIGLNALSTRDQLANLSHGITITSGAKATTVTFNTIAGNMGNGILITDNGTSSNIIQNNLIGTIGNNIARGNNQKGIAIVNGASLTIIGGVNTGNTIAFNGAAGIAVGGSSGDTGTIRNRISRNSIFANGGLGIDLGSDGITSNDVGDNDSGPNALNNAPVITGIIPTNNGNVMVTGTVNAIGSTPVNVEVFTNLISNSSNNPSGFDEGQTFVGAITTISGSFSVAIPAISQMTVTATATDNSDNTSEFSNAFQINNNLPDLLAADLVSTPTTLAPGEMVKLRFNIRNQGLTSALTARHTVVFSNDSAIDL